ncbi:hypothetical protein [Salibacter halophilus]|uniref:Uncharacterized protein n=1 Tax=Salibacter halophilus TaxID=1803916 RepID=A0A6N6MC37_9FLAO|nr:hypothetical protein [Salibacter halophilus]KAB1064884.1 hypothetical protein F3059_05895 [Salibacter halophilus]
MKSLLLTLLTTCFISISFAQSFEVPENYKLEKGEDYERYEDEIIDCIDWLMSTPPNEETEKRDRASKFYLEWIAGTPDVTIELNLDVAPFAEKSPELLVIYMGGWTKKALNSDEPVSIVDGSEAGLLAVIEYYQKNENIIDKNRKVKKLIRLKKKDKLRQFVLDNA